VDSEFAITNAFWSKAGKVRPLFQHIANLTAIGAPQKMPLETLPYGSEFVEPVPCDHCDAVAFFVLAARDPGKPDVEIRTFQCLECAHRMERRIAFLLSVRPE
jgi:hypothetical protein